MVAGDGVSCNVLQQLELASEPSQPGSSLSLRVQPAQPAGTPATSSTPRQTNENSDAVNNNVMSRSVANTQTALRVQRSSSTTNQQKPGKLMDTRSCVGLRTASVLHALRAVLI